ncbi:MULTISPECIES: SIMPL domain-containing protein [unclassified Sphingomonas]|jgi:uncharacterized protein|nr:MULTISPECIES: SIMPL domain-containing protein [unclassified Sphingomonas]
MRNMMLGALLGLLAANGAMAQDKSADATIQVLGVGTVEEAPTIAHISFKLRGEGKGSDDALRALVARKEAVARDMGALAEAKFRLETGDVGINEVRGRDCRGASEDEDTPRLSTGACAVLGYVAMMEASVDVSPVALAGTLSGLASRAGASEVRLSRFRTADPRAAQQRAMAAAVANGQEQAQAIAAASGAKLGRLVRVSDQNGGYAMADQLQGLAASGSQREARMREPVAVEITPQAITTTARLVLVYEIAR